MFPSSSSRDYSLCLLLCLALASPLQAETAAVDFPARPRIGLVLGGGGAKGAAHIGVLRVLEEMRIPIDCVAGTSMGALVGATYASGATPEEIEETVLSVDWSATVGSAGARDRTPINRKLQGRPYTNSLDLGITSTRLKVRGGFLDTQEIEALLRKLVAGARQTEDFDDLPIPFRAVATDMVAGEMVVLGEGDLTVAMRASMAVPGAFSPVIMGEKVLSDGGQMRNVPVDIARDLCGDVIIAVSLQSPPPKAEDLRYALVLAGRSLDVMIDANAKAQMATLTDRDVGIVVPMGDIGSASFDRVPDAIPLGREAALGKARELARYSVPPAEYQAWRAKVTRDFNKPVYVAKMRITGLDRVNPEYAQEAIKRTRPGTDVSPDNINADSTRLFALGDFEKIEYKLVGPPAATEVEFIATEKSWGPDFVTVDLGLGWTAGGDFSFALSGQHRRTWLNPYGGEWYSSAQVGQDLVLQTALYQPLEVSQRVFIEPHARFERYLEDLYIDGAKAAEYAFSEAYTQIDVGVNVGTRLQIRAGIRQDWGSGELETGDPDVFPSGNSRHESDLVFQAIYDTRDTVGLPSQGSLLKARVLSSGTWLDGDEDYGMAEALALKVVPFRGDALYIFAAGGAEIKGELPFYRLYRLGGIRSFPGLERQQLRGTDYWLGGLHYNWKLADIQSLFGQALYGGVRLTSAGVANRADEVREGAINGIALSLGGRTPLGPFLVSFGVTDNNFWEMQLAIGRPIREGSILDAIW